MKIVFEHIVRAKKGYEPLGYIASNKLTALVGKRVKLTIEEVKA